MYKMSSTVVEVIESTNVKCFLKSLRRHGEVLTLDEMYARDEKECNKIAMGIVIHKYEFLEEGGRKLLKIDLKEVYSNGQEGKLFHMFLFGSFAIALKDKKLKNAYVAFRSVNVENNTSHRTQKGDHDLQALLGCPVKKGAKLFLFVKLRNKNLKNSAVLPAKRRRVAHVAIDEERPASSVVEVEPPRDMYKYKKISEFVIPENKVNMYGVVAQILRGVEDPDKHAILKVIDETCKEDQYFRVHIFFRNDRINPRFDVGDIVRFHRMKVEKYYNVIDGRICHASDMVTFPPKGTGKEGAYSTAQSYHFSDSDKLRLDELRKWIQSKRKENKPRDSVLMIGNVSEKGTYTLGCKVLRIDKVEDDMLILIVTDCIPGKTGNDQTKKKEIKIVAIEPPDQLKTIPVNTDVILNNVEVDVTFVPGEEQERIIIFYKMVGPSCTFRLLRRFEDEAVTQRKLIRNLEQSEEENNTADDILKQMSLFNSSSEKLKDSLELQNIDDGMKQVLTQMKEAAADNNVGRRQRTQDSAHFGNSDYSLLGVVEKLIENSQMSSSTAFPDAPKENIECHVLPSTSKSKSIVSLSPQKIHREVAVSDKLRRKVSVPKSSNLADLQAKEHKQQRTETNQKDARNAACHMQDKSPNLSGSDTGDLPLNSPRNASPSEKCGIPAKDNVLQSRKLTSKPNESHQIDDTSDVQDSNKTTPKKVPRKIFTLSADMPNATCISNKQDLNKIMNNILVRVVEKHCTSFEDEKLTNPFTQNLLKNKSLRRNAHQGSGSNYTGSNCRLPTKDDTMDRKMRDRSEKNLAAERKTAQDTHLSNRESISRQEKVVKIGSSSSQQLVTIEQSKKDSLLTILPITNKGEAKRDGINNHSPEHNNPSTFKEIAQVESQKQSLEITSHPALDDVNTYDSHPMQTHNICLISEQQKLPHSVENVDTRNEELLPTSDCSKNISEADTGREFSDNEIELTTKESSDVTYSQFTSVSKKNSEFCTSTQSSRNVSSGPVLQAEESRDSPTSEDGSRFASDITDLPGLIDASISHVKQQEVHEETIFVLKAWLTKIEPSIDLTQKFPVTDIIFGSCHSCSKHYSCRAINYEVKHKAVCKNCHEQGKKVVLNLSFLLRLHLLDENDDSLVLTLCGPNAVDFLGCTVELYLGDECIFNRVNKALSRLILQDKHLPPTNRGLMLKLIISPIISSKGVEYIMHNTFLYIDKCLR